MELFLLYSRLRNVDYHRTLKEDPRVGSVVSQNCTVHMYISVYSAMELQVFGSEIQQQWGLCRPVRFFDISGAGIQLVVVVVGDLSCICTVQQISGSSQLGLSKTSRDLALFCVYLFFFFFRVTCKYSLQLLLVLPSKQAKHIHHHIWSFSASSTVPYVCTYIQSDIPHRYGTLDSVQYCTVPRYGIGWQVGMTSLERDRIGWGVSDVRLIYGT